MLQKALLLLLLLGLAAATIIHGCKRGVAMLLLQELVQYIAEADVAEVGGDEVSDA